MAAVVEQPHLDGRGQGPDHRGGHHRPQAPGRPQPPAEVEHDQDHGWPHDVELLLDGQRPHVGQGRRLGRHGEVVAGPEDEVPVGHVEQGRQRGHPEQHHQQRREEPPGPTGPELPQADGQPGGPLAEEQRGDQEARQHEEDVDGEEAAGQGPAVIRHHAQHRQRPQSVEGRHEPEADGPTAGHHGRGRGIAPPPGGRVDARTHRVGCLRTRRGRPVSSTAGRSLIP